MENKKWTTVTEAEDVTPEMLERAEGIYDGWYADVRIDWEDFLDRLERGAPLDDGTYLDMGADFGSPAIAAIKAHIRKYAK